MTIRTITHLYDTYDEALRAVDTLEAAGIPHADISLIGNAGTVTDVPPTAAPVTAGHEHLDTSGTANGAGAGATLGTVLGGGAGLLAGIGALAIPGIGPVVAAGWLVATLTGAGAGAAAGGLLGGLTGAGVSETDAHLYTEGVRAGGTLVSVRADETLADRVDEILGAPSVADIDATDRPATGWDTAESLPGTRAEDVRMRSPLV